LKVPEPGYECVRKPETNALIIRNVSKERQRQDGERRAFAARRIALPLRLTCQAIFEIGLRELRVNHAQRAHKSVSFPHDRLEEARFDRVIAQGRTNFPYNIIDIWLDIDEEIRTPQFRYDVLAGNQLLSATDEKNQKLHGLLLKPHPSPVSAKFVTSEVQFHLVRCLFCGTHGLNAGIIP
jgi:hypothetical protein